MPEDYLSGSSSTVAAVERAGDHALSTKKPKVDNVMSVARKKANYHIEKFLRFAGHLSENNSRDLAAASPENITDVGEIYRRLRKLQKQIQEGI